MGFPFLIWSMLWLRLLLGTGARFASLSRRNLAAGAFIAVLVLADVLAVALVDEAVDELKDDVESVLEAIVEAEPALVGTTPVLGIAIAEAISVSFSLGFAV